MGVSATGKSSVAAELGELLGLDYVEGDDLHPQANLDKMAEGIPLDDDDRRPWLEALAGVLGERHAADDDTIITCSALRRSYRDILRSGVPGSEVFFLHLHADFDVLLERMNQRTKHFMPASLLESQFDTLEPLEPDELGTVVDVAPPLETVVEEAAKQVRAYAAE